MSLFTKAELRAALTVAVRERDTLATHLTALLSDLQELEKEMDGWDLIGGSNVANRLSELIAKHEGSRA